MIATEKVLCSRHHFLRFFFFFFFVFVVLVNSFFSLCVGWSRMVCVCRGGRRVGSGPHMASLNNKCKSNCIHFYNEPPQDLYSIYKFIYFCL